MKVSKPQATLRFTQEEENILALWNEGNTFRKSVEGPTEAGQVRKPFSFYDGPPFATGLPHYGHLLASTIKDVVPRYWTMQGYRVERRFGWDCHGLPVEFELEKELGLKGRQDILNYGVARFNEACRGIVLRYATEWEKTITRMGRWIDFKSDYKTMDLDFMESVWAIFKRLFDQGLIYEDKKVLPYSTPVASPLSNFEANLNYQMTQDPSVYVKLPVLGQKNTFLVIWTTTPWTLPANLGVAAHPEFTYAKFEQVDGSEVLIGHEGLLLKLFEKMSKPKAYRCVAKLSGQDLVGLRYQPLFNAFHGRIPKSAHQVFPATYVTADSGTGLVHLAPAFGEDDYQVGKENGLEALDHLDEQGHFTVEASIAVGKYFKDADKEVMASLKERNLLLRHETLDHSYPFCYRSDTPLIYRAISTWFVRVTAIKDDLLANNQQVHWVPEHLKSGRFGKWLEGAKDWAISRNRFWGNPIPIWRHAESGETLCLGSRKELEELTGQTITDLHKHLIDDLKITKGGKVYERVPQVLDCWFESGAMPYAQQHFPFAISDEAFSKVFPADFIAEGLDQTRGWFYTLSVLSAALGKGPAFKNVVVNGIVLAEDGRKMSKRLKNYPQPEEVLEEFGADALRMYLLQSPAVHGDDLRFSKAQLAEMVRKVLLPTWNAYVFFATYAAIDGFDPCEHFVEASKRTDDLDVWIGAKFKTLTQEIDTAMASYALSKTVPPILEFLDQLNNWYIRRSRRRFWKSGHDAQKWAAYSTLYEVLVGFSKVTAPFMPFLAEGLYQRLRLGHALTRAESVHLSSTPHAAALSEAELTAVEQQDLMRRLVRLGRELREKLKIKTRQPLALAEIGGVAGQIFSPTQIEHLKQELNVKDLHFRASSEMALWKLKPNFRVLGKKLGADMKAFQAHCAQLSPQAVGQIVDAQGFTWNGHAIALSDLEHGLEQVPSYPLPTHSEGTLVLALQSELTEDLEDEGFLREFIHFVQECRKNAGLDVEDRIDLWVHASQPRAQRIFAKGSKVTELIEEETLSTLSLRDSGPGHVFEFEAGISLGLQRQAHKGA